MQTEPHRYRAFELAIASDIALPELEPELEIVPDERGISDVIIRLTDVAGPMPPPEEWRLTRFTEGHAYFAWQGIGRVQVRDGRAIDVDPLPGVDHGLLSLILLGPVMAALVHQRGDLVLHGSAVEVAPGRVALFVGDNGAGKSTLAGAFLKAGYRVLTDDVIALYMAGQVQEPGQAPGKALVRVAFPAMKLSREALSALAPLPGEALPPVPANAAKLRFRFAAHAEAAASVLTHIYVVGRGADVSVTTLDPAERLGALMRYSYMPKFGLEPLSGPLLAEHFHQCAAIANSTDVSLLSVPQGLDMLMQVVKTVAENMNAPA